MPKRTSSPFTMLLIIAALVGMGWGIWHLSSRSSSTTSKSSLQIKEWNVKIPLSSGIADATYSISRDDQVHVTTTKLNQLVSQVEGCKSGLDDVFIERSLDDPAQSGSFAWGPITIKAYHYYPAAMIQTMCVAQIDQSINQQISDIESELLTAVKQLQAQ